MPQFAVETFSSQIFWVLVGFFAIYVFMVCFVTPNLRKVFEVRGRRIDSQESDAAKLNEDAERIERDVNETLSKSRRGFSIAESKLIASLKEQSEKEKRVVLKKLHEESTKNCRDLAFESEKCFQSIRSEKEVMVAVAIRKVFGAP